MAKVVMYEKAWCPYCQRAKQLLQSKRIDFEIIDVDGDAAQERVMIQRSGRRTVPQIFVGDVHVGGYDDMAALERRGQLDPLLAQVSDESKDDATA